MQYLVSYLANKSAYRVPPFQELLQRRASDGDCPPGRVADMATGPEPVQQTGDDLPAGTDQPGQLFLPDVVGETDTRFRRLAQLVRQTQQRPSQAVQHGVPGQAL